MMGHLTEEEQMAWENWHDEIVLWGTRWAMLTQLLCVLTLVSVPFAPLTQAIILCVLTLIGSAVTRHYARKHEWWHREMGSADE